MSDLIVVSVAAAVTVLFAIGFGTQGGPAAIRVPLGFLFVFFLPGYALAAALFPVAKRNGSELERQPSHGIDLFERLVLSVGLSIAVVPLVALGLTFLSVPIELLSVLSSIALVTVVGAGVAAVRRYERPPRERFRFEGVTQFGTEYVGASPVNVVVALLLALSVLGGGVAIATQDNTERYTEFGLLSEDETGELSAGDYPTELTTNSPETLHLELANSEGTAVDYTVVVLLHPYDGSDPTELDRLSLPLEDGERTIHEHQLQVADDGQFRVRYLLYRGEVPAEPTRSNAHRSASFNVDVTD